MLTLDTMRHYDYQRNKRDYRLGGDYMGMGIAYLISNGDVVDWWLLYLPWLSDVIC